jgi:hypothetical protein
MLVKLLSELSKDYRVVVWKFSWLVRVFKDESSRCQT